MLKSILIPFIVIILVFALLLGIAIARHDTRELEAHNEQYLDEDGDHTYYDRRLIDRKRRKK